MNANSSSFSFKTEFSLHSFGPSKTLQMNGGSASAEFLSSEAVPLSQELTEQVTCIGLGTPDHRVTAGSSSDPPLDLIRESNHLLVCALACQAGRLCIWEDKK